MTDMSKTIGSTSVKGVALVMRSDEAEQNFELSWEGNGLSGCEPFSVAEEAGRGWSRAITALREDPHSDPFVQIAAEMAF